MFSLQRLLSKSDRFFNLLEASAAEAQQSVQALLELIDANQDPQALDHFSQRRREDKRISAESLMAASPWVEQGFSPGSVRFPGTVYGALRRRIKPADPPIGLLGFVRLASVP